MTAPNPRGVQRCIRDALAAAGIAGSEVDLINGHLTATMADPREVKSWQQALGVAAEDLPPINSTKSMIGHALGAAGGIECVASVLQLDRGFVHGSLNCEDLHPELEPYRGSVPHETRPSEARILAKASFGFGDVNGCVIFRKWETSTTVGRGDGMDRGATFQKVVDIIKPFVKNQEALAAADETTQIRDDLGVNSARLVDIVLEFEDQFGIEIDDEAADRVHTLGDAVTVIEEKSQA
jgi:acyl carrier protein